MNAKQIIERNIKKHGGIYRPVITGVVLFALEEFPWFTHDDIDGMIIEVLKSVVLAK